MPINCPEVVLIIPFGIVRTQAWTRMDIWGVCTVERGGSEAACSVRRSGTHEALE